VKRGEAVVAGPTCYIDDAAQAEQQLDHSRAAARGRHHERRARLGRHARPETDQIGQLPASPRQHILHPVSIIRGGELEQQRDHVLALGDLQGLREISHCS
jgi:hypothetical protein